MRLRAVVAVCALVGAGCVDRSLAPIAPEQPIPEPIEPVCAETVAPVALPEAIVNLAAVSVGREMFVIGSPDGIAAPHAFYAYAPETGVWRTLPTPPFPIVGATSAATDGKRIYLTSMGQAAAFDVAANAWTVLPPPPEERFNQALAVAADGRLYCFGGEVLGEFPDEATARRFYVFDPATAQWTARENAPQFDSGLLGLTLPTGAIYVGAERAHLYDPSTDTWSVHAAEGRYWARGALRNKGHMFTAGGSYPNRGTGHPADPHDEVRSYDATLEKWNAVTRSPFATLMSGAAIGCDQRLYLFGGTTDTKRDTVQAYDLATGTWQHSQ